jgi:RHS repeat-associated protein
LQRYIWGNELLASEGAEDFAYLQDHLNSPIRLLGKNGKETQLAYDEFGVPLVDAGKSRLAIANPFGFTGYQKEISAFHYAQARYYDPQMGRFTAQDILKGSVTFPATLNGYSYCYNNPINFADLDGLSPKLPEGLTIFIDPGHGGSDTGAIGRYKEETGFLSKLFKPTWVEVYEKDINLEVSLMVRDILESKGVTVIMSRTSDQFLSDQERVRLAIDQDIDLFISIHHNSSHNIKGTKTFFPNLERHGSSADESKLLAEIINDLVSKNTGLKNKKIHESNHYVVNQFLDPHIFFRSKNELRAYKKRNKLAILTETGYMGGDIKYLIESENLQKIAESIASGILEFYSECNI